MKKLSIILITLLAIHFVNAQSVAINKAGNSGNAAAALDLSDASNNALGFLMTNVSIGNVNSASPITSPPDGLIVYNTNASTTGGFGTGFYYWSTTGNQWYYLTNSGTPGGGTVTTFSSGNLSPLFTTSVSNATTTPALSFSMSNAGAYTILGNNTGSSATPTYFTPTLASSLFSNQGTTATVLHGNASGNPTWGAVNLTSDITGNLPMANIPSGGSSTTYLRGDGTWTNPTSGLSNLTQGTGITAFTYNGSSSATVGLANTTVTANSYGDASHYTTFTVNAQGQLTAAGTQSVPTALPPNGSAGGDLSNSYPNPTVAKVDGASVPAAGSLTTGNVLQVNGSSSLTYGAINLAGGANYVTGILPTGNLGTGTANSTTFLRGDGTWQVVSGGSGTVTTVSSGNLSPLFTSSVANATTTPSITYTLTSASANTILGNNTGSSAAPTYFTPSLTSTLFANQGTTTTVLHGNAAGNPSFSAVSLTTDVTGNLPVTNLNSGSGAGATTFWCGNGTWATPSIVTHGCATYCFVGVVTTFTVPVGITQITITAVGGNGGYGTPYSTTPAGALPGLGALVSGTIAVTAGHVLDIQVGAGGADGSEGDGAGGGGGTFIWDASAGNTLLVAAGGGGGANAQAANETGGNGQTSNGSAGALEAATTGTGGNGAGGTGGAGSSAGAAGSSTGGGPGAGGAGWGQSSANVTGTYTCGGGIYPLAGANPGQGGVGYVGGASNGYGGNAGYGGGGGGNFGGGGGGGGYNGGGGGNDSGGSGGGGGSYFNGGTATKTATNYMGAHNGSVVITW